jgi:hypothetical protein
MLDSFLAGLQQVGEICYAESEQVCILGRDRTLPPGGGALSLEALAGLEAVDSAIAPSRVVGSVRHFKQRASNGTAGWCRLCLRQRVRVRLGAYQGRGRDSMPGLQQLRGGDVVGVAPCSSPLKLSLARCSLVEQSRQGVRYSDKILDAGAAAARRVGARRQ